MPSFALITEGITDQVTISAVLAGYYDEEPDITEAQPLRDATEEGRQGSHAGWEKVLTYCSSEFFAQQFYVNDFVIIQIDTDVCGHKNFDIPLKSGNKDKPTSEIINDIRNFIVGKIDPATYARYKDQIIFAVSIHSLECWILPIYGKTKIEKERVRKCESLLEEVLKRFDIVYKKDFDCYQAITKPFLTRKKIDQVCTSNESFRQFVGSLPS
jgi:hypothetical protein